MNSSDAVSETSEADVPPEVPDPVASAMEMLAPSVAQQFGSGNFATVAGAVSLFRGFRSYRKGDRKRALLQAAVGLFWLGVVVVQRRRKGSSGTGMSDVVDTSPDVEDAVEPGERETDHATGEEVVDTTDADIDESDTAPEVETSEEVATDEDVDQRDVVGSDEEGESAMGTGENGENEMGEGSEPDEEMSMDEGVEVGDESTDDEEAES